MTPTVETRPLPAIPQDVLAFAAEKGVTEYLPGVLELTRRAFPGAPFAISVEEDAEIEDYKQILFDVTVGDLTVEQLMAAEEQWTAGIFRVCPSTHVVYFNLMVR